MVLNCTSKSRQTQPRKYGDKWETLLQQTHSGIKHALNRGLSLFEAEHNEMAAEVENKTLIQNETIILKRECRSKEIFKQLRYLNCLKISLLLHSLFKIIVSFWIKVLFSTSAAISLCSASKRLNPLFKACFIPEWVCCSSVSHLSPYLRGCVCLDLEVQFKTIYILEKEGHYFMKNYDYNLFVGIDVSKDKHDCFILSSEGEVLADVFTIPNNLDGFRFLLRRIRDCTHAQDKIKVGLEATGHYSYNLLGFLLDNGLPTYVLNPLRTNIYRKSLSLRKTKKPYS